MSEPPSRPTLFTAPPAQLAALLRRPRLGSVVFGDAALKAQIALDAIALFAATRGVDRIHFCGRAGAHFRDRFLDLMEVHGAEPPPSQHIDRFDPIDFGLAAEAVAAAASLIDLNVAVCDPTDPIDAAMLSALNAETPTAPLPPLDGAEDADL